jgi:hypothetical protein
LEQLLEPLVLESLLGGDSFIWIIDEYLPEKVEELPVEIIVRLNGVLLRFISLVMSVV